MPSGVRNGGANFVKMINAEIATLQLAEALHCYLHILRDHGLVKKEIVQQHQQHIAQNLRQCGT